MAFASCHVLLPLVRQSASMIVVVVVLRCGRIQGHRRWPLVRRAASTMITVNAPTGTRSATFHCSYRIQRARVSTTSQKTDQRSQPWSKLFVGMNLLGCLVAHGRSDKTLGSPVFPLPVPKLEAQCFPEKQFNVRVLASVDTGGGRIWVPSGASATPRNHNNIPAPSAHSPSLPSLRGSCAVDPRVEQRNETGNGGGRRAPSNDTL